MPKVIELNRRTPDAELVAMLTELLAHAQAGELCALAGVAEYHDGRADHLQAGACDHARMAGLLLASAMDYAQDED